MTDYGVMNEEQPPSTLGIMSMSNSPDIIIDNIVDCQRITVYIKITDSDIRTIQVNTLTDTVGSIKVKVKHKKAFAKELSEGLKVRMIYRGRIMLDPQSLSIYSKKYLEMPDKAYIHAAINQATISENQLVKKEEPRGFEKLESSGFNVDDIHNLRFHFHAMCIYTGIDKSDEAQKLNLEDEWLDGKIPAINANLQDRSEILLKNVDFI
ncbi:hypothetical protein SteCoe_6452 [Stentor coeruleus]|uniref:DSC E3 ubiquitin ligase complex subunit 3 C-terminal domain-containing protein n=1 Tax=Stentor coeruleus TaxID=5963 RepID=A0A1R2CQ10_9CILI|nr:hypothetical protein SteCoe_6452 [Stentor coeruleus]